MAAITITAANVVASGADSVEKQETLGGTVTAGQPVYKTDGKVYALDVDSTGSATTATAYGIAMAGGVADDIRPVLIGGTWDIGATVTKGAYLLGHPTAGSMTESIADLGTGDRATYIAYTNTTTSAIFKPVSTGDEVA